MQGGSAKSRAGVLLAGLLFFVALIASDLFAQSAARRAPPVRVADLSANGGASRDFQLKEEAAARLMRRMCALNQSSDEATDGFSSDEFDDAAREARAERGVQNLERLLPTVKRLVLASLNEMDASAYRVSPAARKQAALYLETVRSVVLERRAGALAWIDEDEPDVVHVGIGYAPDMTTDERAVFLLGHELTHVAALHGNLRDFIKDVTRTARERAGVTPTEDQAEDLACDFVGSQALKRFIRGDGEASEKDSANNARMAERFARAFDYDCEYGGVEDADDEHLSDSDTFRALLALDPEINEALAAQ